MDTKIVIFDFDGTIADTGKMILAAKQETMRIMGYEVASEEAFASTIGYSSKEGFRMLYPELSEEVLDRCQFMYRKLVEEIKDRIGLTYFPNVDKVLATLKERGIMCTIATSRDTNSLREFLRKWGMDDYFPYVLGNDNTDYLKPHPEPVLKTLRELSYSADQALVIGDMPMDIEMGKKAGVRTCGVTYGNGSRDDLVRAGADHLIDHIEELLKVI